MDPPGDTGLARCDDGITLILIAESTKYVIKLAIHLGNPGWINKRYQARIGLRSIRVPQATRQQEWTHRPSNKLSNAEPYDGPEKDTGSGYEQG